METVLEHHVEPEIALPPPRRARLPGRMAFLLAVAYVLLGLFALGSGRALWEAGKLLWIAGSGHGVVGRIVAVQTEAAPEKGKPAIQTALRYVVNLPGGAKGNGQRTGWIGLSRSQTDRYYPGQPFPFRAARWFGGVAAFPWQPAPTGRIGSLLLCGGLVLLVSVLLLRRLTLWFQTHWHLLRQGVATVGTITHKRTEADDMVRCFVRYGYALVSGKGQEREEQVSQEQWRLFEVGQPVTVLYDPTQPDRAGLYMLMRK